MRFAPPQPEWMRESLCAQTDPDLFFPEGKYDRASTARQICGACPVLAQCRDYALNHPGLYGIWGGMSASERRKARAEAHLPVQRARLPLADLAEEGHEQDLVPAGAAPAHTSGRRPT